MRISDWSSDVCSSDLAGAEPPGARGVGDQRREVESHVLARLGTAKGRAVQRDQQRQMQPAAVPGVAQLVRRHGHRRAARRRLRRSEEHTYELQSLMRITYAVFCLKKKR